MVKRKRKSPMKESALVLQQQQQPDLFILPSDLLWEILLWSRPDDDDQYIWLWLCRVSGTCKLFRRLVQTEKKGGVPSSLLPTKFELLPRNGDYLNEGPSAHVLGGFNVWNDTAFLRVELMKVVRLSSWMGSKVKCIHAWISCALLDATGSRSLPIAEELKRLVTSPCLPNLVELQIKCLDVLTGFNLVDEVFLRGLAQQHSALTTLILVGLGTTGRDRLIPTAFANFAASMPHLQQIALGDSISGRNQAWFGDGHLGEFLTNLNTSLTSLALDFKYFTPPTNHGGIGALLSTVCPKLESLQIHSKTLWTRSLGRILRSKSSLAHVDVSNVHYGDLFGATETNDAGVMDAIVETPLKLQTVSGIQVQMVP